jgi:hypothetical protein
MSVALASDFSIDPNTTNGTQLATILDRLHGAGLTSHAGAARPPYATAGTIWLDTSTAPGVLKWFDGATDQLLVTQSSTTALMVGTATQAGHAMNLGQADGRYLLRSGGTLTGNLVGPKVTVTGAQGTAAGDLTRKDYVDAQVASRVKTAGDTMTGHLVMSSKGVSSPAIQFINEWGGVPTVQIFGNHNGPAAALDCIMNVGGAPGATVSFVFRNSGVGYAIGGWQQGSDRRLKSDITKISNAMDKVNSIGGYTFKRTDLGDRKTGGVIAQEVQAVLPESVSEMGGENNYLAVDPMPLIGLLVEAVKELSAQVEALKAQPGA